MTAEQQQDLTARLDRLDRAVAALGALYRCHYDKEMQIWLKAVQENAIAPPADEDGQ